jgi:hypothetical protein
MAAQVASGVKELSHHDAPFAPKHTTVLYIITSREADIDGMERS